MLFSFIAVVSATIAVRTTCGTYIYTVGPEAFETYEEYLENLQVINESECGTKVSKFNEDLGNNNVVLS